MPARYRVGCRAAARRSCPTGCLRRSARPSRVSRRRRGPCLRRTPCAALIGCSTSGRHVSRLPSRVPSCTSIAARRCTGPTAITRGEWRRCWRASRRCTIAACAATRRFGTRISLPSWRSRGSCCIAAIPGEAFCTALAEAQSIGLPVVVQPVGMVAERVVDGVTGMVAADDAAFAAAAIRLLRDDERWRRFHKEALARQRGPELGRGRIPVRGADWLS